MPEPPTRPPEDLVRTETGETVASPRAPLSRHVPIARGDVIDRYQVRREVGAGGVGVVLEAFDPDLGRRVAIKVLQVGHTTDPQAARAMLLREGQAIAQLSHPNVVAVFDVGQHGDEMFIAMEYIAGDSLKDWMAGGDKSWRDVVAMFLQAGRGLAAAHSAGIVHRDFKPSNVLIGDDGRVRVLDFGLARVFDDDDIDGPAVPGGHERMLSRTLTVSGSIAGTPAYMSPEQYAGETPDARSDMFSFCVALYEALTGRRPFAGNDIAALSANVLRGAMRPWPAGDTTPRWLRAAVERGLATDPDARFESMNALLDELARDPSRTRRTVAVVALVAAAVAVLIYLGVARGRGAGASACAAGADRMAAIWSEDTSDRVRDALRATEVNHWEGTAAAVARMLDERAAAWIDKYTDVCEATSAGEQSAAALDARMRCLDRRALEIGAVVERLTAADAELADAAIEMIDDLSSLAPCDDVDNLLRVAPLPDDPDERARIEAVERRLEDARVAFNAGRIKEVRPVLDALITDADAVGFARVIADAKLVRARIAILDVDIPQAEALLVDAIAAAAEARDAPLEAHASITLLRVVAKPHRAAEEIAQVERAARAAVARAGNDGELAGRLLSARAVKAEVVDGDLQGSYELSREALEVLEKATGARSLRTASALYDVAATAMQLGELDEAVDLAKRSLDIQEELLGSEHPQLNDALFVIGRALQMRGDLDGAAERFGRMVANTEARFGADSRRVVSFLQPLASVRVSQGRYDEGIALLERAIRIDVGDLESVWELYTSLGRAYAMSGDYGRARETFQQSLDAAEKLFGTDSDRLIVPLSNLGMVAMNTGDDERAVEHCGRVIDIVDKTLGADAKTQTLMSASVCLAGALLNLGRAADALPVAERAVRVAEERKQDPGTTGQARFFLGRAQYLTGDRRAGIATARRARDEMARAARPPRMLAQVDAWLESVQQ